MAWKRKESLGKSLTFCSEWDQMIRNFVLIGKTYIKGEAKKTSQSFSLITSTTRTLESLDAWPRLGHLVLLVDDELLQGVLRDTRQIDFTLRSLEDEFLDLEGGGIRKLLKKDMDLVAERIPGWGIHNASYLLQIISQVNSLIDFNIHIYFHTLLMSYIFMLLFKQPQGKIRMQHIIFRNNKLTNELQLL